MLSDDDETPSLTTTAQRYLHRNFGKHRQNGRSLLSLQLKCPDTVRRKHLFNFMEKVENKYRKIQKKRKLATVIDLKVAIFPNQFEDIGN